MGNAIKQFEYTCPSCGANEYSEASECCDFCILTMFAQKPSPDLATAFDRYKSVADWENDETDYTDGLDVEDLEKCRLGCVCSPEEKESN